MAQKIQSINLMLSGGKPLLASYLREQGYSSQLLSKYVKSRWMEMPYKGVYIKPKTKISMGGLLSALIFQKKMPMHIAGLDALRMFGYFEQIPFINKIITLYSSRRIFIPKWVKKYEKKNKVKIKLVCSKLFMTDTFIKENELDGFSIPASIPERAIFEALNDIKSSAEFYEYIKVFELIVNLKYEYLDTLLKECSSIKIKRLFLYVSQLFNKPYFKKININRYKLGSGARTLFTGIDEMKYDSKYKIMVPKTRQS